MLITPIPHQQPLVEDMLPPCLVNSLPPEKASHGTVPKARIGPDFFKSTLDDAPRRIDSANRRRFSFAGTKRWCVTHWKTCHVNVSCHLDKYREREGSEAVYSFTVVVEILCDFLHVSDQLVHWLGDMILCKTFDYLGGLMTVDSSLAILGLKNGYVSQFRDTNRWCFPTTPGILCYFYEICISWLHQLYIDFGWFKPWTPFWLFEQICFVSSFQPPRFACKMPSWFVI